MENLIMDTGEENNISTEKTNFCAIDLGTGFSVVGIWENNRVNILSNDSGNRTTPSIVSFGPERKIIGEGAEITGEIENIVYDIKRLIGRRFSDPEVQEDKTYLPYVIKEGENDSILVEVEYQGAKHTFSPEEISAMILTNLKELAENHLGEKVTDAVVTVPAYFSDSQRQATRDACTLAGLVPLRLVNEPTAASLAYGLDTISTVNKQTILCFDFGSGTLDVSLICIDEGIFEVKAVSGNNRLGGRDITNRMMDHLIEDILEKYRVDVSKDERVKKRLRLACEDAKKHLTSNLSRMIQLESLIKRELTEEELADENRQGDDKEIVHNYAYLFTRAKFEDICSDIFKKTLVPVVQVLEDSEIPKHKIDQIVLIGGSSRIPKVQKMLEEFFDGKELNKSIDPDECVAFGATIQAAILTGQKNEKLEELLLLDVCPISLGVETNGGIMTKIINRNSTIPLKKTMNFSTSVDNQQRVLVKVYEGERILTKDCKLLGQFYLENLPALPRGRPEIEVTLDVDLNSILKVSAVEKSSGNRQEISVVNDKGRLDQEKIDRMIKEAEEHSKQDKITENRHRAKTRYHNAVIGLRNFYEGNDKISEDLKNKYERVTKQHLENFENTENFTTEQYEEAFEVLKAEIGIADVYVEKPELL